MFRSQWETAQHEFNQLDLRVIPDGFTNKDIANICRRRTTAQTKMELKGQVVDDFEIRMGIEERWMMTHPEHVRAQSCIANMQYHKALNDVERLVVMRLLELTKLQMSSLGKLSILLDHTLTYVFQVISYKHKLQKL